MRKKGLEREERGSILLSRAGKRRRTKGTSFWYLGGESFFLEDHERKGRLARIIKGKRESRKKMGGFASPFGQEAFLAHHKQSGMNSSQQRGQGKTTQRGKDLKSWRRIQKGGRGWTKKGEKNKAMQRNQPLLIPRGLRETESRDEWR